MFRYRRLEPIVLLRPKRPLTGFVRSVRSSNPAAHVIALPREVDAAVVETLEREADGARRDERVRLVIDMRAVAPIDNPTLCGLCVTLRHLLASGARVALVGADLRVQGTLALCGLDGLGLSRTVRSARRRRLESLARSPRPVGRGLLTR